jgi:nitrite reductase/ring-hydroxylating ferredoxin subunit
MDDMYRSTRDREQVTIPPDGRPLDEQPAWRRDFPIDWPMDQYVERRDFMKFMVLTSLAFTVGQFWIGAQNWWRRRRARPEIRRIGSLAEIPVGGAVTFAYPEEHDDCILVRTSEGTLVAYGQQCTHLACAVRPRPGENLLHCPCHEGYFDLQTGRPVAGPPRRPLPLVNLEVRGGDVYATGVDERTV